MPPRLLSHLLLSLGFSVGLARVLPVNHDVAHPRITSTLDSDRATSSAAATQPGDGWPRFSSRRLGQIVAWAATSLDSWAGTSTKRLRVMVLVASASLMVAAAATPIKARTAAVRKAM